MRLRRSGQNRNASAEPGEEKTLLNLRQAFILSTSAIIAATTGLLTFLATANAPQALLAVITAGGSAVVLLNRIIS
jgi:hypothetical protein